jgi:hypothetical protein
MKYLPMYQKSKEKKIMRYPILLLLLLFGGLAAQQIADETNLTANGIHI